MKYIYVLAIMAILLSAGGCTLVNDSPRHTAEEVVTIARGFNTQCQKLLPTDNSTPCSWGGAPIPQYEEADPTFTAEYVGNGIWNISKACPVDAQYDLAWYFNDNTNELVWSDNITEQP